MKTGNPSSPNVLEEALETGFHRCVRDLRSGYATTPLGWLLVFWSCWDSVPQERLLIWLGAFVVSWLLSILLLTHLLNRNPPRRRRDGWMLYTAAALDGIAWAAMLVWLGPQGSPVFYWLLAILCGCAAVTAPIYTPHIRAHAAYLAGLYAVILVGAFTRHGDQDYLRAMVGLALFTVLLYWFMRRSAREAIENVRLQFENTALNERLSRMLQLARRDAETDALTGLANRRHLDSVLSADWSENGEYRNSGQALSVLMLDLDRFKRVNDEYSHEVGDQVLKAFAVRAGETLREQDLFARYGGEEFIVLLPGAEAATAMQVAERIRASVGDRPLLEEPRLTVTVSIGVAQLKPGESTEALLARADAALYAAKRGGRNRVELAQ